jgi:hypothetical protein
MAKIGLLVLGMLAVVLVFGLGFSSCATLMATEGAIIMAIDDALPEIEDGSYVCSRAQIYGPQTLQNLFFGKFIEHNGKKYALIGANKSVAIRIANGKVREIMAVVQGQGETQRTYATATQYFSVEPVMIPSVDALDRVSDFNEAKAMLH